MNAYPLVARAVAPLLALSLITNLAVLVSPLFMMQVLDRVIPSGNTATLVLLGALALGALSLQAIVEAARDTALGRMSRWVEGLGTRMAITPGQPEPQPLIARAAGFARFLGGQAAQAALNAPWIPVFLLVLVLLHPAFLLLLAGMAAVFVVNTLVGSAFTRAGDAAVAAATEQEEQALMLSRRFATSLGLPMIANNLRQRFASLQESRHRHRDTTQRASSVQSAVSALIRNSGQVLALALGALLVTLDQISPGGMIAGSIITSKAYMAIESTVTQWTNIRGGVADFRALAATPVQTGAGQLDIEDLSGELRAEALIVPRGGGAPPRLDRVSFALEAGQCLAIVGSSGSGKSTLLRALAGVSPAPIGSVFLDQSEIRGLGDTTLYRSVGFLPQRADMDAGTIAENISCFEAAPEPQRIIEAAKDAGVHGLISALPDSYDTDLAVSPFLLSAGQCQRVALARAIYSRPRYLFLDEPNALLDADGERALAQTLLRLKQSGTTVVMAVHRSGILGLADKVMRLEQGRVVDFGDRSEVLGRLGLGGRQVDLPLLETSLPDLRDWIASHFTRATDQEFCQKTQIVGVELFQIARANTPDDTLSHATFSFRFIDDTHCELTMIEPNPSEIEAKMIRVQSKLRSTRGMPINLPRDEAGLATVSRMSERFEVRSLEDATHFNVALTGGVARQAPERLVS